MLAHREIENYFADLSAQVASLTEYRQATTPYQVTLAPEMAAALGTPQRRLTPFLATVVDVIASKLEVNDDALKLAKVSDTKVVRQWLGDNDWSLVERDLYRAVVRDEKAFVLTAWTSTGPTFRVLTAYNGLSGAHIATDEGVPVYGWNTWTIAGVGYCDVYYPNRIEKYIKPAGEKKEWVPRQDAPDEAWPVAWTDTDGQPLGIALTEFAIGGSDIADALQVGRDMNEALLDMLAASRTQGWPQRWIRGQKNPDVLTNDLGQPIISSTTGRPIRRTVNASPGSIMLLSDGSEMGQLDGAEPTSGVLDKLLELLSLVTTVSSHYFTGQWPSGVALIQADSRLNHKIEAHQGRLSGGIAAMLRLAMRLSSYFAGTAIDQTQPIVIPWHAPQIETEDLKIERQKATEESVTALVAAGLMSKEVAIRALHTDWNEEQIGAELLRLGITQNEENGTDG